MWSFGTKPSFIILGFRKDIRKDQILCKGLTTKLINEYSSSQIFNSLKYGKHRDNEHIQSISLEYL